LSQRPFRHAGARNAARGGGGCEAQARGLPAFLEQGPQCRWMIRWWPGEKQTVFCAVPEVGGPAIGMTGGSGERIVCRGADSDTRSHRAHHPPFRVPEGHCRQDRWRSHGSDLEEPRTQVDAVLLKLGKQGFCELTCSRSDGINWIETSEISSSSFWRWRGTKIHGI
jgi:hypothetical protein